MFVSQSHEVESRCTAVFRSIISGVTPIVVFTFCDTSIVSTAIVITTAAITEI